MFVQDILEAAQEHKRNDRPVGVFDAEDNWDADNELDLDDDVEE